MMASVLAIIQALQEKIDCALVHLTGRMINVVVIFILKKMKVKVINKSNHRLPEYKHPGDAGMDLKADISEPIVLKPGEVQVIPTGLYMAIPDGYEIQVRSRSGLAAKESIFCLNSPGTIDSGYRNNVGVILANFGKNNFVVNPGDRIAQAVLNKFETIEWDEVTTLDETERGEGGFGSTGR